MPPSDVRSKTTNTHRASLYSGERRRGTRNGAFLEGSGSVRNNLAREDLNPARTATCEKRHISHTRKVLSALFVKHNKPKPHAPTFYLSLTRVETISELPASWFYESTMVESEPPTSRFHPPRPATGWRCTFDTLGGIRARGERRAFELHSVSLARQLSEVSSERGTRLNVPEENEQDERAFNQQNLDPASAPIVPLPRVSQTKVPLVSILVRGPSCACRSSVLNLASLCRRGISSPWNSEMDGNGHCSSGQSYCRCVRKGLSLTLPLSFFTRLEEIVSVFPLPLELNLPLCGGLVFSVGIGSIDIVGWSREGNCRGVTSGVDVFPFLSVLGYWLSWAAYLYILS